MGLPMDNIFFRFLLQCWPILLAAIASVLLVYSWKRPKLTAEKLQKGLIRQSVVNYISETEVLTGNDDNQEWLEARKNVERHFTKHSTSKSHLIPQIRYRDHISLSLAWIIFWGSAFIFVTIRMIFNPVYYGAEAIFLGYFAYYIVIGLISFFRK